MYKCFIYLDTLAVLDQVTNTEGVSYAIFIVSMTAILASFIAIMGVLINVINTRLMRIEDKQDKTNESLFLIKAHLGLVRVEEKPDTKSGQNNSDNESK